MSKKAKKNHSKEGFIQVSQLLLQSTAFTPAEKLIIAYLNSWNNSTGVCFETNPQLAAKLDMGLSTIKDAIKKLDNLNIISKFTENRLDTYKKIYTHREIRFNEANLVAYLVNVEEELNAELLATVDGKQKIKKNNTKTIQPVSPIKEMIASELVEDETEVIVEKPAPTESLKDKVTRADAVRVYEWLVDDIDDIFNLPGEEAKNQLRAALMTHPKLSQEKIIIYNLWLEDFYQGEFQEMKSYFANVECEAA